MIASYDVNFDEKVDRGEKAIRDFVGGDVKINCREVARIVLLTAQRVEAEKNNE